jgi:hypothetical protein
MAKRIPQDGPLPFQPHEAGTRINSTGSQPSVGQSKPYVSGANARGRNEKRNKGPAVDRSRVMPYATPTNKRGRGWDDDSSR